MMAFLAKELPASTVDCAIPTLKPVKPPAISTFPVLSSVAVCPVRGLAKCLRITFPLELIMK
jgi:hypothetical protein